MSLFGNKSSGLDAVCSTAPAHQPGSVSGVSLVSFSRKRYTHGAHQFHPDIPDGNILIHAGDLTQSGSLKELQATVDWLQSQPHSTKIVVAGNHDVYLDQDYHHDSSDKRTVQWGDIIYLQNSETTITCSNGRRLRIYGSPYSPRNGNWAFQYPRSKDAWDDIPEGIDILITHCPPRAHLDLLNFGCVHLLRHLWRVRPRLHVFGHVHEGAGREWLQFNALQKAFEQSVISKGGLWNLMAVIKEFVYLLFYPITESKCLLVNAAIIGGLRDDKRRQPIKVII
ncbi:hypothetical protein FE257_012993 [Aspergillus nanangensis]|uniref:Calcineurin-like phosphoesterase domain-containing protein n=1 Tax=Aspergillus nanangensis TaxID=2582783 RepID=A0AAD4CF97_ASPNN|nr:hypothetical protein FE257_012993 [Aspergillus nanangensis]